MSEMDRRDFLIKGGAAAAIAALSAAGCKTTAKSRAAQSGATPAEPLDATASHGPSIGLTPTTEEAAGLGAEEANAPTMSDGRPALRLILQEADGSPLDAEKLRTLHARDLNNDPLPQAIVTGGGRARVELNADEPIQISVRLKVPGFGEIYCYADNEGRGYRRAETIDLVAHAARTRYRRVRGRFEELRPAGLPNDPTFNALLAAAGRPIPDGPRAARLTAAYENLAAGLHAGERLALNNARLRISRFTKPRTDFHFGVAVSGFDRFGPAYQQRIRELSSFSTCQWYTWRAEQFADTDPVDYARMDASVQWCLENKITPKIFGYLYMTRGATPEWIRPIESPATAPAATRPARGDVNTLPNSEPSDAARQYNPHWNYDRIKDLYHRVIRATCKRFDGRAPVVEVMNEAHDKANLWGMSHEQVLDMAKMAFRAAREGSPTIKRQMNHCCMWGEYAKRRNADGTRRWSPYQFVRACFDHGIDYEVIGLQLYYPQNDLFEIDRMLDRFTVFNKKLHITEIATASEDGLDPRSMRPKTYAPGWHGPWSPAMQADWAESIYTICYSKPQFETVGWWDLADGGGHFWPFGGLLDNKFEPKEAYLRLRHLRQQWGLSPAAPPP